LLEGSEGEFQMEMSCNGRVLRSGGIMNPAIYSRPSSSFGEIADPYYPLAFALDAPENGPVERFLIACCRLIAEVMVTANDDIVPLCHMQWCAYSRP